jgi:hypothetical protein
MLNVINLSTKKPGVLRHRVMMIDSSSNQASQKRERRGMHDEMHRSSVLCGGKLRGGKLNCAVGVKWHHYFDYFW